MSARCWILSDSVPVVNALSTPPGEYDRKVETKGIGGGPVQAVEHGFNSKQREEPY